ncbi:MAG: phosphoribosyltransferase family protein, partial [Bacteroidota bacterium]
VDDVANTGRTIFYAFKPLFEILPKKIEVAVLVDRKHKSFPIKVDYVGLSLATTIQENIDVQILNTEDKAVYLK